MCSNYETISVPQAEAILKPGPDFDYTHEIYPERVAPFLANQHPGLWLPGCFGIVPHWGKPVLARDTYNARSETIDKKNSFRVAWKKRQLAVIPVDSFYEPCYETGHAVRHRIFRRDGKPFGLAGLFERRLDDPGSTRWSFTMITLNATDHPLMKRFHGPDDEKRSVVILDDDEWDAWLGAKSEADVRSFIRLFDPEPFTDEPRPKPPRRKKENPTGDLFG